MKLDQDDKDCFSHYKQVKKLSKQLDSAEELIQQERSVSFRLNGGRDGQTSWRFSRFLCERFCSIHSVEIR